VVGWTCNICHMNETGDEYCCTSAFFFVRPLVYLSCKISRHFYSAVFCVCSVLKSFYTKMCSVCRMAVEFL